MHPSKRAFAVATLAVLAAACAPAALAQNASWPTRPIRILVGFPGGSTPDMAARAIAEPLSHALGQPVIIENKPGASGNIATDQVAKSTDDHTLGVVINGNLTSAKMLYPRLPYDPGKDFSYITLIATAPLVLVAQPTAPDGAAFFDAARKAGDSWNYGSVGTGSVGHLGMELLKSKVPGFTPVHIPFQGNPQAVTAIIGGQVQMALVPPGIAQPQAKGGKIKVIGLTTSGRSVLMPEADSLASAGVKDFQLEVWTALIGPASLPKAAQERLAIEMPKIMQNADVRRQLFNQGWQAVGTSSEGLKTRIKQESATMADIISKRGIKIE